MFDQDQTAPAAQHWPRRHQRQSLTAEVAMRRRGKLNQRVRVFDISPSGCRIEMVELARIDERLIIRFEGLQAFEAEVCWVEAREAGLQFERPMHPAVFDLLVARLNSQID